MVLIGVLCFVLGRRCLATPPGWTPRGDSLTTNGMRRTSGNDQQGHGTSLDANRRIPIKAEGNSGKSINDASLVVRVTASESSQPLGGIGISVAASGVKNEELADLLNGMQDAIPNSLGVIRPTAVDGIVVYPVPSGTPLFLIAEGGPLPDRAEEIIAPLAVGERRNVAIELYCSGAPYYGRLIDHATGLPATDVDISIGESELDKPYPVTVNEDGTFVVYYSPAIAPDITISSLEYAPVRGWVSDGHELIETAEVFILFRSGGVHGRLLDSGGRPLQGLLVWAGWSPDQITQPFPAMGSIPFVGSDQNGCSDHTSTDGAYRLEGLPPRTSVLLAVVGDFGEPKHQEEVSLAPGEVRTLDIILQDLVAIDGVVIDQAGKPVEGLRFSLVRGGAAPSGGGAKEAEYLCTSGSDGAFSIEGVLPGDYRAVLAGEAQVEACCVIGCRTYSVSPIPSIQRIVIEGQSCQSIQGKVSDSDGNPVAGATVVASGSCGETVVVNCKADGTFAISPLNAAIYTVYSLHKDIVSETQRVAATAKDVLLELPTAAGYIAGQTIPPRSGALVVLVARDIPGHDVSMFAAPDGSFCSRGLAHGAYDLFVSTRDGLWGGLEGISPSAVGNVNVLLERGCRLRIAYSKKEWVRVLVRRGGSVVAKGVVRSGMTSVLCVPSGHLSVELAQFDGITWQPTGEVTTTEVDVSASAEAELSF